MLSLKTQKPEIIALLSPRNSICGLQELRSVFFSSSMHSCERGMLNQTKMNGVTCKGFAPNFSFRVFNFAFHIRYAASALISVVRQAERVCSFYIFISAFRGDASALRKEISVPFP